MADDLLEETLKQKLDKCAPYLIGLWRFYHIDFVNREWCCTFRHKGMYYDTMPLPTAEEALDACWNDMQELRRRARQDAKE